MSRTALVLGAGIGGIVAAATLRKLLPASDRVIAVDRAMQHFSPPSRLIVGHRTPQDFTHLLDRLPCYGIEFLRGKVTRIVTTQREVEIDGQSLCADNVYLQARYEF